MRRFEFFDAQKIVSFLLDIVAVMCKNGKMNREQVMEMLDQKRAGRDWRILAAEIGISESLLSRIRRGYTTPGTKVLKFLQLQKKIIYVRAEQSE